MTKTILGVRDGGGWDDGGYGVPTVNQRGGFFRMSWRTVLCVRYVSFLDRGGRGTIG